MQIQKKLLSAKYPKLYKVKKDRYRVKITFIFINL
jgi:hypothetical protein